MADNSKREKIAAAKKKLKQFQQRSGRTPSRSPARSIIDQEVNDSEGIKPPSQKSNRSVSPVSEEHLTNINTRGRPVIKTVDSSRSIQDHPKAVSDHPKKPAEISKNSSSLDSDGVPLRTTASTESLHQLSRQLNGLLSESAEFIGEADSLGNSSIEELERRNQDLAALLAKHSQTNEQLLTQNQQLRDHLKIVQDQLESERNSFNDKYKKDVGSLKEQLQVHIQTIGILVAEKTELQSQVGQSQRIADQRLEEIEELSGRLKASRQRVSDLERSLSTSSQSGQQLEKSNRENTKEIDRLKLELYKSNKSLEESKQQISELSGKLQGKVSETSTLEQTIEDLKKRLEMAELYAQQLSSESGNSADNMKILTDLQTERDSNMVKLQQLEETVQMLKREKDQLSSHYQQYTEQLVQQIQQQTQQLSSLADERKTLLSRQHDLEGSLFELQRKLEDSSSQQSSQQDHGESQIIQSQMATEIQQLRTELAELQQRHEAQIRDNAQLSRFLEEREIKVLQLEQQVEQMGSEAGDRTQLLESVQSDRTALSRALSQNKELKVQLAELQNGFVKLSNDNMELVTQLHGANHTSNDLTARLAQQEDEIKEMKELISNQEKELQKSRDEVQSSRKQQYHQDQIQDRLQHYEAQAQLVQTLQNELTSAQDMMEALTTQNSELRAMLVKATAIKPNGDSDSENGTSSKRDELIDSLTATIKQLEFERGQIYENLKEQRQLSDSLGVRVADLQEEVIRKSTEYVDSDKITRTEYEQLKTAMEMIQEKYMRVMRDKAELSDKADQLEHLVVQLQGETDTIGEYISLYHHQRALLQQRELQKNEYIMQLARDREQLQDKMSELQKLVMQLLGERNMLHSYHEEEAANLAAMNPTNGHDQPHYHHHHHHHHQPLPDSSIQPHLAANKTRNLANGPITGNYQDWPDYTSSESDTESEVEQIVGGAELPPSPSSTTPSPPELSPEGIDNSHAHKHEHRPGQAPHWKHYAHSRDSRSRSSSVGVPAILEEDQTAHRILSLLSEIGHSNLVSKVPFSERNFLPCKFCKGAVQIV